MEDNFHETSEPDKRVEKMSYNQKMQNTLNLTMKQVKPHNLALGEIRLI